MQATGQLHPELKKQELTIKQELFCLYYLLLKEGKKAAIRAGYSPKQAHCIASLNLDKPAIKARIAEIREKALLTEDKLVEAIGDNKLIANEGERKGILTGIARHPIEKPVTAGHKIAAIEEMDKLDHLYEMRPEVNVDNRQVNIYVVDGETRELLGKVGDRTVKLKEGPSDSG